MAFGWFKKKYLGHPVQGWPFENAQNTQCITVRGIMIEGKPILIAQRDDEGDWQFLDGSHLLVAEAMVMSLAQMLEHDPSIREIADMMPQNRAFRSSARVSWQRE